MSNCNMPKLRLDGFEGEWKVARLGDFSNKVNEKNLAFSFAETFTNSAEHGVVSQTDFFKHQVSNDANLGGYYVVRPNDYIYNPRISMNAPVGPVNRNKLSRAGVVSPLYTVFRVSDVDYQYLDAFFATAKWHSFMKLNGDNGARGDRLSINQNVFFQLPVMLPSLEEQQAIGAVFTNLDAAIDQHTNKYRVLQHTKTALMQKMFPRDGQTEPELRLDGFSGEWGLVPFVDLIQSIQIGINDLGALDNFGIPLLKMGNILRGGFDLRAYERLPESTSISPSLLVKNGDFLFNTRNTMELVGKGATWFGDSSVFTFNGNIARFNLIGVDPAFFNYLYNLPDSISQVQKCATGTTSVAAVYPRSLSSVTFLLPPTVEEQQAIGAVFTKLDTLISAEAQRIEKLKQTKTALLQKMFL